MISTQLVLLIFATIVTTSNQKPFILRSNYKGLAGVPLHAQAGLRRAVYFHEQTVAVVDVNPTREIQACDIIEGYEPSKIQEILQNVSATVTPAEVTFLQMIDLMYRCEVFDRMQSSISRHPQKKSQHGPGTGAFNLLHGIFPGTKWCGSGDLAQNYHDLGPRRETDRCCRTHDLCPVKIRGLKTRYNLSNVAIYSKSHCSCDIGLYQCLKEAGTTTAKLIGTLFFNVAAIECITDVMERGRPVKKFARTGLIFEN